jgi:hypothetical protein
MDSSEKNTLTKVFTIIYIRELTLEIESILKS